MAILTAIAWWFATVSTAIRAGNRLRKWRPGEGQAFVGGSDAYPWDDTYRIVVAKTRGVTAPTEQSPEILEGIIERLFSVHEPSPWRSFVGQLGSGTGNEKRVIEEKLVGIANSLSVGKTPDPEEVPNLAIKVANAKALGMFRSALHKCKDEGAFSEILKLQSLVL